MPMVCPVRDPVSLTLKQGQSGPPVTGEAGVPFFEMLALDSWNERSGSLAGYAPAPRRCIMLRP